MWEMIEKNIKLFNELTKNDVLSFIDDICLISYQQNIHFLWRPFLKDKNDDMVLEVAVNGSFLFNSMIHT